MLCLNKRKNYDSAIVLWFSKSTEIRQNLDWEKRELDIRGDEKADIQEHKSPRHQLN